MAAGSFGWNSMNIHDHLISHARPDRRPPQIACRICYRIFYSTEALIDHIESHMRQYPNDHFLLPPNRDQLSSPPNTYFFPPRQSNIRNPNLYRSNIDCVAPSVPRSSPRNAHDGYGARPVWTNRALAGGTRWGQLHEWVPVTRPFLSQLEHALVTNTKPGSAAVMENQNNRTSDPEALDLTLKL